LYIELNDVIAAIFGVQVPFMLHPITKSKSELGTAAYRLAGEWYVHGLMDGEALNLGREGICFEIIYFLAFHS
jgi:hypothetical protein